MDFPLNNSDLLSLYRERNKATDLIRRMAAAGVEPLKIIPSPTGGTGDVMRPNHDRHGFSRAVVMASLPRPSRISMGGDSIRDAEEGKVRSYGQPIRVYYDAAEVDKTIVEPCGAVA